MTVQNYRVGEWATAGWINQILGLTSNGAFMIRLRDTIKKNGLDATEYIKPFVSCDMTRGGNCTFVHIEKSLSLIIEYARKKDPSITNAKTFLSLMQADKIDLIKHMMNMSERLSKLEREFNHHYHFENRVIC